ncbi:ankyrin [Annulohypoxylon bovei var. microspora]|nr:ankyrin [Annulohypoxylon bovei var. microspora]
MARLEHLPHELFCEIFTYLSTPDAFTVCLLNKRLHWRLFDEIIQLAYERKLKKQPPTSVLFELFTHALRLDSVNLVEWIQTHSDRLGLNGYHLKAINATKDRNAPYLRAAILDDAPRVVARLVKYGTDINYDMGDYPDLTPLYMTLAQCRASSSRALDNALRIACTYALPRTVHLLLENKANPNSSGLLNYSALHCVVAKRHGLPWPRLGKWSQKPWEFMVQETVLVLLRFNADLSLKTTSPKIHTCSHTCWQSFDCGSSGQTALQLAASRGFSYAAALLLRNGADPNASNDDGFRVLYTALAQGHTSVVILLLAHLDGIANPIVHEQTGMTALHAACRFAMSEVVQYLLEQGASIDVVDSLGRTPLYEVLGQTSLVLEGQIIKTLRHLDEYGADPDIDLGAPGGSPRKLGGNHPSPEVRAMFATLEIKERKARLRPSNSKDGETRNAPSIKLPRKIATVQPEICLYQPRGDWASDRFHDVIKDLAVSWNLLNGGKSQTPREIFPLLNRAVKVVELGTPTKTSTGLKEDKKVEVDQSSSGSTQGYSYSDGVKSHFVEPTALRPSENSAALFWKNLPKQQAPKKETHNNDAAAVSEQGKGQTSKKPRTRKTKWKALQLG